MIRTSLIKVLIALASFHNLVIHYMDVKIPFLNGDLEEEIYMDQAEGYVVPSEEQRVCSLVKSLYGLTQVKSTPQWNKRCGLFKDKGLILPSPPLAVLDGGPTNRNCVKI